MAVPGPALRVGIIDDHPVVVEGVQAWFAEEPGLHVTSVGDTLEPGAGGVDVLVLDLHLHGRLVVDDIPAFTRAGQRIVAFSHVTEQAVILATLDAGAGAFVAKSEGRRHLLQAVVAASADRPYVPPITAGVLAADHRPEAPILSEQEHHALLWWFQSMSKASVARRMGISPHTVDMYIRRARVKYARAGRAAPTKADMLVRAIEDGLIRPEDVSDYRSCAAAMRTTGDPG